MIKYSYKSLICLLLNSLIRSMMITNIVADLDIILIERDQLLWKCHSHAFIVDDIFMTVLEVYFEEQFTLQLV